MSGPRVSVVMPARNEERYVELAVRSILEQTFSDFELIVVDNGSTDETPSILQRVAEEDSRIVVLRHDTPGLVSALNAGIASARGDFVARMDSDDISLPVRLEHQVTELDRRPEVGVLGTRVRYIDADGKPLTTWDVPVGERLVRWTLAFGTPFAHPSVMMRRRLLADTSYSSASLHAEDYDLWVRLAALTELDNLRETLLERRIYGASVSDRNADLQKLTGLQIQRRAIAFQLGMVPAESDVQALSEPRSWRDLLGAARLIWRLYRVSGRGADIRRDAIARVGGGARHVLRSR